MKYQSDFYFKFFSHSKIVQCLMNVALPPILLADRRQLPVTVLSNQDFHSIDLQRQTLHCSEIDSIDLFLIKLN